MLKRTLIDSFVMLFRFKRISDSYLVFFYVSETCLDMIKGQFVSNMNHAYFCPSLHELKPLEKKSVGLTESSVMHHQSNLGRS